MLIAPLLNTGVVLTSPHPAKPRLEISLDKGWKFEQGDDFRPETESFSDSGWQNINLPHNYGANPADLHGKFYRGPAWYRRSLSLPKGTTSKRLYLRFGAASLVAQVYVNGHLAGEHKGGFAAFCFDVTSLCHAGDNKISVRTDNSLRTDVMPLSGDFNVNGGLYRDVSLLALDPVSISPVDDASSGIYASANVEGEVGILSVRSELLNHLNKDVKATIEATLLDAKGTQVAKIQTEETLPASASPEISQTIKFPSPHRWNGVLDPYLYKVRVDVIRNKQVVDRVEQPIGFRTYSVDAARGLMLNGKRYDFHGVNVHQGRPSVGWASTTDMIKQDYDLVKEVGATGVRMPHYQHADQEYGECDKDGLVVWAEIPLVNRMTDSSDFKDNAKQQLRELIKQEFNHPSILFWSLFNEAWVDKKKGPDEWILVKELNDESHKLDPSRLTTVATSWDGAAAFNWYTDIVSFNRYWGWYDGTMDHWPAGISALRKEASGRPFGMSEYGAGGAISQHEIPPKQPKSGGKFHPEEYEAAVHESVWPYLAAQDWMWCKLIWVMYDFPVSSRNEGENPGMNDKGLITGDRKTKKDVFFYYKAQWSKEPFVYIASRRFNPRPVGPSEIKVYSNCKKVELFVNGKSLGIENSSTGVFVWSNVKFGAGSINAVAKAVSKIVTSERSSELALVPISLP